MSRWKRFAGLVLVPVLIAGGFLWGTWNANDRLHRVEAAVVNLDESVTINDQIVPLGRELSADLVDTDRSQNFTWVLADEAHAYPGLQSGRYAAVVVIPKNFSERATSYADTSEAADAKQATIQVLTSPVAGIADTVLGNMIADAAAKTLNQTLTKAYLNQIYIGFNTMGKQFTTVADGAGQLADGARRLNNGVAQAYSGTKTLSSGLDQLAAGSAKLTSGAGSLNSGSAKLSTGLATMRDQTATLPSDTARLAGGVAQYVGGVDSLIDQTTTTMGQLPQLATGVDGLATGAADLSSGLSTFQSAMSGIAHDPSGSGVPCPGGFTADQCSAYFAGLATGTGLAAQQIDSAATGAAKLSGGLKSLNAQVGALASSDPSAAAHLAALKQAGSDLKAGTQQLADGMPRLASGISQAASGSTKLTAGLEQFGAGLTTYAGGVSKAATGAGQLADGLGKLSDGSYQLADGTQQLADGLAKGLSKLPSYDKDERTQLAKVVAAPVRTSNLDSIVSPNTALASLLLVLSLWLGAMATYAVFAALRPRLALSTKSSGALLWEAYAPGIGVGTAQALLVAALGSAVLGLAAPKTVVVIAMLLLAAAAFVAVNHALAAWLGLGGRLLGLALAVMGVASAVTGTVPEFFDSLRPFSPVSPALDGLRSILTDSTGTSQYAFALMGWLLLGLLASTAAILRKRTVSLAEVAAIG